MEERCGSDVTKRIALLVLVLRWRYGGLYPPPFRLVLHTAGGGGAVGRTLNKQSNTLPMLSASVYFLPGCVCTDGPDALCSLYFPVVM